MTGDVPRPSPQLAEEDRTRLTKLLDVDGDPRLRPTSEEVAALPGATWSTGFADADGGVSLAAYFIADPAAREAAASEAVDAAPVQVASNGGLLLVASWASSDERSLERVQELLSRFAGEE